MVGGHCIPVDPYYLVYKAKELDYHPQVVLAGRSVNDSMPRHIVDLAIKTINKAGKKIKDSKILIMGLTFKENVSDTRETPVKNLIKGLKEFHCEVYGYDPNISQKQIKNFGIIPVKKLNENIYNCIIITLKHDIFKKISLDDLKKIMDNKPVLIDLKRIFNKKDAIKKGIYYSSL
jgi:UDPglucose 6-dehydrogenase/UDP-N-acetyl-D-galactosamine dehydrogenase